ncbi:hypothetical protein P1J78_08330 [Psychromarinibacter sp. C21-152]|uniref:Uncharacterized protein n=1 Tax=Psychromarinibacter sediminicola TaxID=3033385 RepID=A0AAE3NSC1_9RHOB|nr:hypothetical protein [Psychromarinibacter sediminicola]MDF0600734.1 hypothetical protein [Psychromarinibacter sediminicola]
MTDRVTGADLSRDHAGLTDTFAARRYFRKFEAITGHLARVAAVMEREERLSKLDVKVLGDYVQRLAGTFRALSLKYLMTGRDTGTFFGSLAIDRTESGFPVFRELLTMANDAQQAPTHLAGSMDTTQLKDAMIRQIVGELEIPTKLQFAMSQRLYYEALEAGGLFWAQNDPDAQWLGDMGPDRRKYLLHWAVYDSQVNLPTVYLMELEDSGRRGLPVDEWRWPEVQAHLMAQSLNGLKLLTIAQGFDRDFDDLHPKRLRRFHVGPMYSGAYTLQTGPIHDVLEEARAPEGQDWALAWTEERLESERVERERSGWFGTVEREIFALDPFAGRGVDTGATATERSIIMPTRPFQVLAEKNPPGFREVRKFVVSPSGQVVSYR